jgi:hypothetical protein
VEHAVEHRSWLVAELHQQEQAERDDLNDDHSEERGAKSGPFGAIAGDLFEHRGGGFEGKVGPKACSRVGIT